jgi:hypothetical protein
MDELYKEIKSRLERLRRGLEIEKFKIRFSHWLLLLVIAFLIAGALEYEFYLEPYLKRFVLFTISILLLISFLIYVLPALLRYFRIIRSTDDIELARIVERKFPREVGDKLVDALQIYEEKFNKRVPYSDELLNASFMQLAGEVLKFDWDKIEKKNSKRNLIFSSCFLIAFALSLFISREWRGSLLRMLNFDKKYIKPVDFIFKVEPGDTVVPKGENVRINVKLIPQKEKLKVPEHIELYIKGENMRKFDVKKLKLGSNTFEYNLYNVRFPVEYFLKFKGSRSRNFKISVIDKPIIKLLKVKLNFPKYTGLEPLYLDDNLGDITGIVGTRANFEVLTNKQIMEAGIILDDSSYIPLEVNGTGARGEIEVKRTGSYHIEIKDMDGLKNENPIKYKITAIPDEYPQVEILRPDKNVDVNQDMNVGLLIRIKDDFGFTKLKLAYRLSYSRYIKPSEEFSFIEIPIPSKGTELDIPYLWDLSELELSPDDIVSYYIEVFDNDLISGPKSSKTEIYTIRFPSLREILAQVEASRSQIAQDIKDILEKAKRLRKEMREIELEFKKGKLQMNWQKRQKIQNIAKRYEELRRKIHETSKDIQNLVRKMEENQLLSPETLEKYLELQKLLSELDIPELRELMKRFEQAMRNINPEAIRRALEKFKFSEESFRRSIERTLKLLKRIQIEQRLNEILKQVEQMLRKQEEIRKMTANVNPENKGQLDRIAREQEELKGNLKQLESDLKELMDKMNEFKSEMPTDELEKMMKGLKEQNLDRKIEMAGEQIKSGRMNEAIKMQYQLSMAFSQMHQSLQALRQKMLENQQRQIITQMRKIQQELLSLSKEQEKIKMETGSTFGNSPKLREIARRQMDLLSDLNSVANSLIELSQKTFAITPQMGREIGNALRNMHVSIENLSNRNNSQATKAQENAMSSLNNVIIQLGDAMQSIMQAGGGGLGLQFLLQQLNQITIQQMGLNQATRELMQKLTPEQQAEMARLAAQQELIRKSLEELWKEAELSERERILGDLEQIAREMQEVIQDLESNNLTEETLRKQERILSRLLDAQRSIHERDFEKRRRSRPGRNIVRESPPEINIQMEEQNRIYQDLLRAIKEGYHKDYELLIRKYFELLQSLQ